MLIKGGRERSEIADRLAGCSGFPRVLLISATRAARFYMNENHAAINRAIDRCASALAWENRIAAADTR